MLIDNFKKSLKYTFLLSYLDDVIILSEMFREHLSNLSGVFTKLREFKLYGNHVKCNFVFEIVKCLEYSISMSGLQDDPEKNQSYKVCHSAEM